MKDRAAFHATAATTVAVVLIALLVLVILAPGRFRSVVDFSPAAEPTSEDDGAIVPPVTEPGGTPPPPGPSVIAIDPARPFEGSPAADYPAGIAGLRLPAAKRVGSFPATEVAAGIGLARRYFAASRLDPKVIAGQYPTAVLALLDPESKDTGLRDALRRPTADHSPVDYVTRADPRQDALQGSVIKVNGTLAVRAASRHELVLTIDAIVVYAFRRVDGAAEVTRVVLRVRQELSTFRGMVTTPGTLWRGTSSWSWAGASCTSTATATDGYLHPSYPSEWESDTGPTQDPYDARRQPSAGARCQIASRV